MQHWKIYQKWNKRLFREFYMSYELGKMAKNPADDWYQGEINFFDNYIIPLAKKFVVYLVFRVTNISIMHKVIDRNGK
jgi:hypothetical protein